MSRQPSRQPPLPRRRASRKKIKRKARPFKPPIEVAAAGLAIPFMPVAPQMNSIFVDAMARDFTAVGRDLCMGMIGLDPLYPEGFDLIRSLNPFDLDRSRYMKTMMLAAIQGTIRSKLPFGIGKATSTTVSKIPWAGRRFK